MDRMTSNIDLHDNGSHPIVLAYGEGLREDAVAAQDILVTLLGNHATVELRALPADVHGPRSRLPGHDAPGAVARTAPRTVMVALDPGSGV